MRWLCLSAALLVLLVILVDSIPVNIHHIQDEGLETSHTRELEKRSVVNVVKNILGGVITGTKIVGNGASILTGLAEIINKALKGQVMISGIQFDNHTQEELATLEIEYSTLSEEIKGMETSHKHGLEKRSVLPVVKGILGGVLKGTKIFAKGASILTGLAEIVKKALKGQVMISGIQFDNHTPEELPTLQIEYSTLSEENEGVETSHKHGLEKRSVKNVIKSVLGGVIKGSKIVGKGATILGGLAKILNKTLKGQVMISGIQFDNHTPEELPTLQIEYSTLSEENEGVETSHKHGLEKRSVLPVVKGILGGVLKGTKIFAKGASILTGLAEIVKKALKGQVMISGIQFDNHTQEELPTLQIEYSALSEENTGTETSHKHGLEKRSVLPVVKGILGGVLKGAKIVGKGASILTGLAEIVKKALKGQVMISGIQFDNHTPEELPTLQIEYSTLSEENEGTETSHKHGLEKRSVLPVVKGILGGVLKGTKIFAKGFSILTGLAEIVEKALKGQVMISGIQFDNHTQEELPTLQIEYSALSEENTGTETSHKHGLEKRSVLPVVKGILGGVLKGTKIFAKGFSILTGLAEIVEKALKGQVMISGIQFDNHTQEELPTLQIEYSALSEENTGTETSHKHGLEKRSVLPVVKGILGGVLKGTKIFAKGFSILTGLAEIVEKALKGQVMISGIQFDNHTQEELPTLQIEYSALSEENTGTEASHKHGLEKRSVLPVVKGILGGVLKGAKIVGKGASILTGLAEIVKKALKGQVMISGIQFDNHTPEELPTLQIEYSTLSEENEGVETSHKHGLERRSVLPVVKGILGGVLKGTKIFAKGFSILTGLAEIVEKALKGQVMISGIQFDNHTQEELPTLQIEYSTLSEENKGVETSHKRVLEKRSVVHVVKSILGGVIKGTKIFGKGASILTGLAEIVNKALKGQVMISGIQFDNHTQEEFPTLNMEYSTLSEEMKVSPTSMPAFCVEPKFVGVCKATMVRYFFNTQTGYCEMFLYGDCGGNRNNFLTLEDCRQTCHPNA